MQTLNRSKHEKAGGKSQVPHVSVRRRGMEDSNGTVMQNERQKNTAQQMHTRSCPVNKREQKAAQHINDLTTDAEAGRWLLSFCCLSERRCEAPVGPGGTDCIYQLISLPKHK